MTRITDSNRAEINKLLAEAKAKYPKDSIYYNLATGRKVVSSGSFAYDDKWGEPSIFDKVNRDIVWRSCTDQWASVYNI